MTHVVKYSTKCEQYQIELIIKNYDCEAVRDKKESSLASRQVWLCIWVLLGVAADCGRERANKV
ncbi:MAG: hypothetical protein LUQ38_09275 [Methanotrichaceae archaeon]|nr:hypothetical protein [Methanotrichaceae archaeon]